MLLVTRPREQAQDWVNRLRALGLDAHPLPLLGIHPAASPGPVRQAIAQLPQYGAVMFVSPNAVSAWQACAAERSDGDARGVIVSERPMPAPPSSPTDASSRWPSHTLAVAPGPGTASALLAWGVPADRIIQPPADALQFDSEALWPQLELLSWVGRKVLVVRGEGGRDWLIDRWREAGALVDTVAAYQRGEPLLDGPEARLLLQALGRPRKFVWLLSSSEALDHLQPLVQAHAPHTDFQAWAAQCLALATHPRILERALQMGMVHAQACRADLQAVVASYNQIHREL